MVIADEEDEEEDEEDIDFEDEDFEGEIVFLFGLHAIIHKQPMVLKNRFVFFWYRWRRRHAWALFGGEIWFFRSPNKDMKLRESLIYW